MSIEKTEAEMHSCDAPKCDVRHIVPVGTMLDDGHRTTDVFILDGQAYTITVFACRLAHVQQALKAEIDKLIAEIKQAKSDEADFAEVEDVLGTTGDKPEADPHDEV